MSVKTLEQTSEEPRDASPEAEVEEEFRFDPARWEKLPKGVRKTRLSLDLDDDVVAWFREQAARPGAVPFQTRINQVLRELMNRHPVISPEITSALLNDQKFIAALAERVAAHTRTRKPKAGKQTRRAA